MARQVIWNFQSIRYNTLKAISFITNVNGTPLNLTGASILMQFRKTPISPVLLEKRNTAGITISETVPGKWTLDETAITLPEGPYYYDVQITLADGTIKTYQKGTYTSQEAISHV